MFFIIIFISVLFHLLSSIFSLGWYNADEQSCILEYLNSKLGFESNRCFFNYSKENLVLIQKNSVLVSTSFLFYYC